MTDPWGISGPQFIRLYIIALVAGVVLSLLWRWLQAALATQDATPRGRLTDYDLAYLSGGRMRVGQTAVAALLESGQIRTDSLGVLHRCNTAPPTDPISRTVFDWCEGSRVHRVARMADRAIDPLVRDLVARGLVVSEAATALRRVVVLMLFMAIEAVGVLRLVNGIQLNRPVDNLIMLMVPATVVLLFAFTAARSRRKHRNTNAGKRMLAQARADLIRTPRRPGLGLAYAGGAVAAVALGGLLAYPDDQVVSALRMAAPGSGGGHSTYTCNNNSSCSSGSSCGSSCGGGGCGGGGCGG